MKNSYPISFRRLALWPTLPLDVYFRSETKWRPFPLDQENCRIYSRARHALWNTCKSLAFKAEDIVLVPAYHHGSEIEALIQAGLQIRYYDINETLEPDLKEIEKLLGPNVRAFYLIHYLGFPQNAKFWQKWCKEQGLLFFEDAAQSFLTEYDGQPVGSFGDVGLYCLYKMYGIPDGGAVISKNPSAKSTLPASSGIWRAFKWHINWLAGRREIIGLIHLWVKPLFSWWKQQKGSVSSELNLGNPFTPPSKLSMRLLPKLLDSETSRRRRENYSFLLKHLRDMVPGAFKTLPVGACPCALPIEVKDPKSFMEQLQQKGVLGLLFWSIPHQSLPVDDFPVSKCLRSKIVALPVHQELTHENLIQIVEAVLTCSNQVVPQPVASSQ